MSRTELIDNGKIWHVYKDGQAENILFEGTKTAAIQYIKEKFGMRQYKKGAIRLARLIWEQGAA